MKKPNTFSCITLHTSIKKDSVYLKILQGYNIFKIFAKKRDIYNVQIM